MNNPITSGDPIYGEVLDIKKVYLKSVKKNVWKIILGIILSFGVDIFLFSYLSENTLSSRGGMFLLASPWLILGWCLILLYGEIREAFWKQIALKYNWEYTATKKISDEKALLFKTGHSKRVSHGIIGSHNNIPFHIFEYSYTVGYGKHSTTYALTVFEIKLTGTFPHLYLDCKGDGYSNPPSMFNSLAQISLPEEFRKKFRLYSPKEYEIETLEIFTPNIFQLFIDLNWKYNIEFVDSELIIYKDKEFDNFQSLDEEITKIKNLVDILSPLLNRLKLAQIGDIPHSLIK